MRVISVIILFSHLSFIFGVDCTVHRCATSNMLEIELFGLSFGSSCICKLKTKDDDKSNCCQERKVEIEPNQDTYLKNNVSDFEKNFQDDSHTLFLSTNNDDFEIGESSAGYERNYFLLLSQRKKLYLLNETFLI